MIVEATIAFTLDDGRAVAKVPALGDAMLTATLSGVYAVGDTIGIVLSPLGIAGPTLDMALGLPEDVRDSPHLASVLDQATSRMLPIDGQGHTAAKIAATCRERSLG